MKFALFLHTLCLVMLLGCSWPIDHNKQKVNRPTIYQFGPRGRRAPPSGVKGLRYGIRAPPSRSGIPLEMQVTKGEYVCGNKICKLPPGVPPKGCNGMCQYPLEYPI